VKEDIMASIETKLILDGNIKDIVAEAVLRSLDEQKREALIQGAITHLLKGDPNDPRSLPPIERFFRAAVDSLARELMEAEMQKPEVKAKLAAIVGEATERALEKNREKTVEKISGAIYSALYSDGRY
jgi:hypothetical protein